MSEPRQIVHRIAADDFRAWQWADAAARLGWRVVTVTPNPNMGGRWSVYAEAPVGTDPDDWDHEHESRYGDENG